MIVSRSPLAKTTGNATVVRFDVFGFDSISRSCETFVPQMSSLAGLLTFLDHANPSSSDWITSVRLLREGVRLVRYLIQKLED